MTFERPSLPEIVERVETDVMSSLELSGKPLRRSMTKSLSRGLAGASHGLHGHLSYIAEQAMPDTATTNLLRWASIWGIGKIPASYADGPLGISGIEGSIVETGALYKRADGVEFEVLADATISSDGLGTVSLRALISGSDGNTDLGTTLTLVSPIAGVNSEGQVEEPGIDGGSNEESLESIRTRLLERLREPPLGGANQDYIKWAKEVAGVTRVWPLPLWLGEGTVGVTFVRDNDENIIPSTQEVEDVADYIETKRPVTAHVTVFAPSGAPVNFTIHIEPDTAAIRTAVQAELTDLIFRDGSPGGTTINGQTSGRIFHSRMNEAISISAGESDHTLISPTGNFQASDGYLPTMGTITWV